MADFIKKNVIDQELTLKKQHLQNPKVSEKQKQVFSIALADGFAERDDMFWKRALTVSEMLQEEKGVCIDLAHLYASVLYKLGVSDIKLIQGTAFGVKHVWPEVVIEGRPYVVDTTYGTLIEFVDIGKAYKNQKLIPDKMYEKDSWVLRSYDFQWYVGRLDESIRIEAEIDALEREYDYMKRRFNPFELYVMNTHDFTAQEIDGIYQKELERIQQRIDQLRVFGSRKPLEGGFKGSIYNLSDGTGSLPDFAALSPVGAIYTYTLNIPSRSFDTGFPGVSSRYEWFAIRYEGEFAVKNEGVYAFELNSDDGSRLIIDGDVVVDNDGIHAPSSAGGSVHLEAGVHTIQVEYFQGPRYYIALQLFVTPPTTGAREVLDIRKCY